MKFVGLIKLNEEHECINIKPFSWLVQIARCIVVTGAS